MRQQLVYMLIDLCVYVEPEEYVPLLSKDLVNDMIVSISQLPKKASDIIFLEGGTFSAIEKQSESVLAKELNRVRAFGAAWRMRAYFDKKDNGVSGNDV